MFTLLCNKKSKLKVHTESISHLSDWQKSSVLTLCAGSLHERHTLRTLLGGVEQGRVLRRAIWPHLSQWQMHALYSASSPNRCRWSCSRHKMTHTPGMRFKWTFVIRKLWGPEPLLVFLPLGLQVKWSLNIARSHRDLTYSVSFALCLHHLLCNRVVASAHFCPRCAKIMKPLPALVLKKKSLCDLLAVSLPAKSTSKTTCPDGTAARYAEGLPSGSQ